MRAVVRYLGFRPSFLGDPDGSYSSVSTLSFLGDPDGSYGSVSTPSLLGDPDGGHQLRDTRHSSL